MATVGSIAIFHTDEVRFCYSIGMVCDRGGGWVEGIHSFVCMSESVYGVIIEEFEIQFVVFLLVLHLNLVVFGIGVGCVFMCLFECMCVCVHFPPNLITMMTFKYF